MTSLSSASSRPSQIPALVPAPAGWTYIGCYQDDQLRVLDGGTRGALDMTVISCISLCQGNGFSIAGVENGTQCYCGNSIKVGAIQRTEPECGMACAGDASQRCGDVWRLNIYQAQSRPAAAPSISSSFTLPSDTNRPLAPAPSPSTSNPSSTAITSTGSLTFSATQPSSTRTGSENTLVTATYNTYSTNFPSFANISATAVTLPPPADQIFTPNDSHSPNSALSSAVVAGIAVATTAITAIILALLLVLMVRKWRRRKIEQAAMTQHAIVPDQYSPSTYRDTPPEDLPAYSDSQTTLEHTVMPTNLHVSKPRLKPSR
ncbi:hypothetical protein CVT24_011418 [Panaeolus cyanescens]|uniref:WSC domain-containing protein n=1 Tax=Panaeolus cyanescens TaxID=181874 RepID=A0A409VG69_9AGAR|nr:hypothetical protein CVT24_011418 [Panaeolus cyanescens]